MARTAAGATLTEQHRQAQIAVRAQALRYFIQLWPVWQGDGKTFARLVDATVPLVMAHHQLSSSAAAAYFEAFRRAERVGGSAAAVPSPGPDLDKLRAGLWVTGQGMTRDALAAGFSPQAAMQTALTRVSGTVTRQVLMGGRDAVVLSTAGDRRAGGWVRVTSGDPCAFCAMSASNGAIFSEDTADFEAHAGCACTGEPAYPGSDLPGRAGEFRDLWNQHGGDFKSFRAAIEGRAPTAA
jgi:hypothetical protein